MRPSSTFPYESTPWDELSQLNISHEKDQWLTNPFSLPHGCRRCIKRELIHHANFLLFSCTKMYLELDSKRSKSAVKGNFRYGPFPCFCSWENDFPVVKSGFWGHISHKSFRALDVPEPRMRKRLFSLTKMKIQLCNMQYAIFPSENPWEENRKCTFDQEMRFRQSILPIAPFDSAITANTKRPFPSFPISLSPCIERLLGIILDILTEAEM